jgi:phage terminase Nu1 subunit (DNA packaging protein)
MPKDGEGPKATHPWPEARDWYNGYLRAQERKKEPEDDLKELRKRKFVAEVRKAELEIEEAEGRVVRYETVELRLGAICDRLRNVLMTVPSKFLSRIQVTRTDLESQAVGEQIRDELLRALQGTSQEIEDEDPELPADTAEEA